MERILSLSDLIILKPDRCEEGIVKEKKHKLVRHFDWTELLGVCIWTNNIKPQHCPSEEGSSLTASAMLTFTGLMESDSKAGSDCDVVRIRHTCGHSVINLDTVQPIYLYSTWASPPR